MISMDALEIGDYVRSGKEGEYSRVFSFAHLDRDLEADFLQIHTEGSAAPLEITNKHMLFVSNKAVVAENVMVGDMLGDKKVTEITSTKRTGVYAPVTYAGSIVVEGVKSSSYAALLDNAPVNQHHMIHMFFSLQRAACSVNFSWCEQETYTNGYSNYSNWAIQLFGYFNTFSAPVQWLVTAFSGVIFALWCTVEQFVVSPILAMISIGFLVYKSQTKKVKSA